MGKPWRLTPTPDQEPPACGTALCASIVWSLPGDQPPPVSGSGRVIGCVYIYPSEGADGAADVRSWVRADRAGLDVAVHDAVSAWLDSAWPFTAVSYAPRTGGS